MRESMHECSRCGKHSFDPSYMRCSHCDDGEPTVAQLRCIITELQAEVGAARDTNRALNRRCQSAESELDTLSTFREEYKTRIACLKWAEKGLAEKNVKISELQAEVERMRCCAICRMWRDCDYEACYKDMRCDNPKSEYYRRGTYESQKCPLWQPTKGGD
jgi:hypothetical protein